MLYRQRAKQTTHTKPQFIERKSKIQQSLPPYRSITKPMFQLGPLQAHSTGSTTKKDRVGSQELSRGTSKWKRATVYGSFPPSTLPQMPDQPGPYGTQKSTRKLKMCHPGTSDHSAQEMEATHSETACYKWSRYYMAISASLHSSLEQTDQVEVLVWLLTRSHTISILTSMQCSPMIKFYPTSNPIQVLPPLMRSSCLLQSSVITLFVFEHFLIEM